MTHRHDVASWTPLEDLHTAFELAWECPTVEAMSLLWKEFEKALRRLKKDVALLFRNHGTLLHQGVLRWVEEKGSVEELIDSVLARWCPRTLLHNDFEWLRIKEAIHRIQECVVSEAMKPEVQKIDYQIHRAGLDPVPFREQRRLLERTVLEVIEFLTRGEEKSQEWKHDCLTKQILELKRVLRDFLKKDATTPGRAKNAWRRLRPTLRCVTYPIAFAPYILEVLVELNRPDHLSNIIEKAQERMSWDIGFTFGDHETNRSTRLGHICIEKLTISGVLQKSGKIIALSPDGWRQVLPGANDSQGTQDSITQLMETFKDTTKGGSGIYHAKLERATGLEPATLSLGS